MNPKFKRPVKDPIPSQNLSSYPAVTYILNIVTEQLNYVGHNPKISRFKNLISK